MARRSCQVAAEASYPVMLADAAASAAPRQSRAAALFRQARRRIQTQREATP